jgi:polysaccharide chain length determinant protein (PEP-CTERM system associated)
MAGNIFNALFDELQRIWRYRWLALTIAAVLFAGAAVYIMRLSPVYEASAQVYVSKETPIAAAAHGMSLVGENFGSAYVVQKTLLNDPPLRRVLFRIDPNAATMNRTSLFAAMNALRSKIHIDPDQGDGFVQIRFQDPNPVRARNVVRLLLDQFIAANVSRNTSELESAEQFLNEQIASYAAKARAADAALAAFTRRHPSVVGADSAALIADATSEVASAQAAYTAALVSTAPAAAATADDGQIAALRARIATLRTQYTDQYPDVVAAQRQLNSLLEAQKSAPATAAAAMPVQSASVRTAHDALMAAQARLRRAQQGPPPSPLDAEWANLKKQSALLHGSYDELVSRREAARLSQAVYAGKHPGKYQITSPPTVPLVPSGPDRRLYLLLAGILCLGVGMAAAYLRGAINGIFVTPRELEEAFGLPVAGTVSLEETWRTNRRGGGASALSVIAAALFIIGSMSTLVASDTAYPAHMAKSHAGPTALPLSERPAK